MLNIILKIKNPNNIFEYCHKYNVYIDLVNDSNSHFWLKLLEKYYNSNINLKNEMLSLKDFYVLMFYCELFTLIDDKKIINRAQQLLLQTVFSK